MGDCLVKVSLFLAHLVLTWWQNELSGLLSLIVLEVPAYKWKPIEDNYYYNIIIWAQTAKYPTFNCNITMAHNGLIWYRGGEGLGNACRQLPSLVKHSFVHPQLHVIICLKHYIQAWSASRAYSYICSNAAISNHHFEYCTSYWLVFVYVICDKIKREDWH